MSKHYILVINAGSSSLKFKLFDELLREKAGGIVERIGLSGSFMDFKFGKSEKKTMISVKNHTDAIKGLLHALAENRIDFSLIKKIGHRVVHGGEKFIKPTLLTKKIVAELKNYNKLAPLHNPNNIAGIESCMKVLPQAKNFAVFDTAFHSTLPDYAYLYPLPYRFYEKQSIRRYGFHGISHQYVALQAEKKLKKKKANLITCHLGSGCSITAISAGKSVDTSMGFTPLEGLMMSTRTGDIDPAIAFYLLKEGMTPNEVNDLFNFQSGLKGVSGLKDMRDIMLASGYKIRGYKASIKFSNEQKYLARLALKMFFYRVIKYIGAYVAILGKVDAIVFTAGIGERNKDIRDLIMRGLRNKYKSLVIPTNEELMIARLIANK
ncbi:acetate/propionate family kinase [Patescibacteria group bacterium]|nr:acetate/propionate family kinase [Patescibacteria group bacterium]